jgi:hypothetical protein
MKTSTMQVVADTFPAGTLSGAQKQGYAANRRVRKQIVILMEVP